jgi:hypothetical protein
MTETGKEFSPEFQKDIADLLELCMNNHTDSLTITLNYGKNDLDIDMTFKVYPHSEVEE